MELRSYKKFATLEESKIYTDVFEKENIPYQIVEYKPQIALGQMFETMRFELKINGKDFEKANEMVGSQTIVNLDELPKDHYLFDFSDEELLEIVAKPDEWNPFDYQIAQKILKERGKEVSPELLNTLKKVRINDLKKPEPSQKYWIIAGYVLSIFGGLVSVLIGLNLWTSKKTLPNGEQIFSYTEEERKQGKRIFIIGCIFFVIMLILRNIEKYERYFY